MTTHRRGSATRRRIDRLQARARDALALGQHRPRLTLPEETSPPTPAADAEQPRTHPDEDDNA